MNNSSFDLLRSEDGLVLFNKIAASSLKPEIRLYRVAQKERNGILPVIKI